MRDDAAGREVEDVERVLLQIRDVRAAAIRVDRYGRGLAARAQGALDRQRVKLLCSGERTAEDSHRAQRERQHNAGNPLSGHVPSSSPLDAMPLDVALPA